MTKRASGTTERPSRNDEIGDDPSSVSAPIGDGGVDEAARYVVEAVVDLGLIARRHGFDTLCFLLDMAQLEAEEIVRLRMTRSRRSAP